MMVSILGKKWKFRFTPFRGVKGEKPDHGRCDHPEKPRKEILINSRLVGRARLEAILHESLHAAAWHWDESAVQDLGADLSRLLWRLGYRIPDDS
tara:strand:+ start:412 stop:696 length:285 start_codon:yes stop_codon:yes gene_type:complete